MSSLALFLTALDGGGAERVMLYLARGFVERGLEVDLVLAKARGPYLSEIPKGVRLVDLGSQRLLLAIPALVRYLKQQRPAALLSAMEDANLVALWSRRMAGVSTRAVVSVHNTLSQESQNATTFKRRFVPYFVPWFYPWADAVVTVSRGAAEDLAGLGLSKGVEVIYNPVVTPELWEKVTEPLDHPWFGSERPPVILGVGRLEVQKDFATLIRAFAQLRKTRLARLMILGEGSLRPSLEALVRDLELEEDVALPGFVANPYSYMGKAAAFVLSSLFEALPTVLIEAIAVGTPAISTDCKSGPAEILENGRYGTLVEVGDVEGIAAAIASTLENPPDSQLLRHRGAEFSLDEAVAQYMQVLHLAKST